MSITALSTQPNSVTRPTTFNADTDTYHAELPTLVTEINATVVTMSALAAGGAVSLQYTFSTTTTDADPGAGTLRLNNATQNASTVIRADLLGNDTSDYSGVLALLDDSTSTNKGYITMRHATTPTKWLVFAVASLASPSGYKNVTVTCAASSAASPFTNGDSILLDFSPTGDAGVAEANVATFLATPTLANLNSAVSDADLAILGANTFAGDQTYAENVAIVLAAGLADAKYSGIVEAGIAGAALAFGELCYFQTADSRWELAQAAAAQIATACLRLGICVLAAGADGDATKMLLLGKIRANSLFPTMTIGAPVYMSAATAGVITSTAPTGTTDFTVRRIGYAVTGDELYFNPSNEYVTLV